MRAVANPRRPRPKIIRQEGQTVNTHTLKIILAMTIAILSQTLPAETPSAAVSQPSPLTQTDRDYLRGVMKETWHYIDFYRSPITGFPYDSSQARDKTNTTNIGLYLASLCMASKLGYIRHDDAAMRVRLILDSLETFENWQGLYNNWLDPDGKDRKAKPGENNISDYNKLPAGLIAVRQTFPEFADRCTKFLDGLPWEAFHDPSTGKICYAFDVAEKRAYSPVHFFRGEDKLLGQFLMIASGKVPADTWEKRDAGTEERHGVSYFKYGWQGGGLFMHFICGLFLDQRGTPLGTSSANFAWAQIVHGSKIGSPVWGWSAAVAPNGEYLGMDKISDEVVTPHASSLAVHLFPAQVVANLRQLESFGLRDPMIVDGKPQHFGFRDSVNWANGTIADKYLVLDQAMLFLSLVNACEDGLLWKTFGEDPLVRRGIASIAEYKNAPAHREAELKHLASLDWNEPSIYWLRTDKQRTYVPGDRITRQLWARSISSKPLTGCVAQWSVLDSKQQTVLSGKQEFSLAPGETRKIAEVAIPTDGAQFGKPWTLKSNLTHAGKSVLITRNEPFYFLACKNLEGDWKIKTGDDPSWAAANFDDAGWTKARVPVRWEDDGLAAYDGLAWYRTTFNLSQEDLERWADQPLAIAFGAIDDADETFLNGVKIGGTGAFPPKEQTAYNVARIYQFDRAALKTNNVLAVRVSDWGGNGGIWRSPAIVGPIEEVKQAVQVYE